MEPELQMAALGEINPYIGRQKRLRFRSPLITHYDMSLSKPRFFLRKTFFLSKAQLAQVFLSLNHLRNVQLYFREKCTYLFHKSSWLHFS
jgi:hypothetical protein